MDEAENRPSRPVSLLSPDLAVLLVVGIFLVEAFLLFPLLVEWGRGDSGHFMCFGFLFSQPLLLAAWLALWAAPLSWRLYSVLFVAVASLLASICGAAWFHLGRNEFEGWPVRIPLFLFWLAFFILVRDKTGLAIVSSPTSPTIARSRGRKPWQQFVGCVLGIAVALGGYLWTRTQLGTDSLRDNEILKSLPVTLVLSLPAILMGGALIRRKQRLAWFAAAALAVVLAPLMVDIPVPGYPLMGWLELLSLELSIAGSLIMAVFFLRLGGWRFVNLDLVDSPSAAASSPAEWTQLERNRLIAPAILRRHVMFLMLLVFYWGMSLVIVGCLELFGWVSIQTCFLLTGLTAAQPLLLAMWAGLYAAPARIRVPAALGAAFISSTALMVGIRRVMHGPFDPRLGYLAYSSSLVLFAVLWPICRLMYAKAGWRILGRDRNASDARSERQFGVRDLFAWTAGVAVALTIARLVLHSGNTMRHGPDAIEIFIMFLVLILIGVASTLPALLAAGVIFRPDRKGLCLASAQATATAIVAIGWFVTTVFLDPRAEELWVILGASLMVEFALTVSVLVTLALLNESGWRCVSVKAGAHEGGEASVAANSDQAFMERPQELKGSTEESLDSR